MDLFIDDIDIRVSYMQYIIRYVCVCILVPIYINPWPICRLQFVTAKQEATAIASAPAKITYFAFNVDNIRLDRI